MKHLVRITFAVFLIAASPFAHAQSSWSTHTRAGEYAFAQGDLERHKKRASARRTPVCWALSMRWPG